MEITGFSEYKKLPLNGKNALITGASAGIGLSTACFFASLGVNLKLVSRRKDRLEELKNSILEKYPNIQVDFIAGDICLDETILKMEENNFFNVDILINNAGLALGRELFEQSFEEDYMRMIDVNIKSAFKMVHKVLPYMKEKKSGDIICISSIAGHYPYDGGAVYCATKHALRAFSTAIRLETCGTNIRVIQISPGMVDTEFSTVRFKGDKNKADEVYQNMTPLVANDIAHQIVSTLLLPRHVNIDEMIIVPTDQGGIVKVVRNKN